MLLNEITDEEALATMQSRRLKKMQLRRQNPTPFSTNTTDMPEFDRMLNDPEYANTLGFDVNVEWMRPKDYVSKCVDGFKTSHSSVESSRTSSGKVNQYAELIKSGTTFPMLVLQHTLSGHFTQEGLHRAFAAEMVGIETVPVLVVTEVDDQ